MAKDVVIVGAGARLPVFGSPPRQCLALASLCLVAFAWAGPAPTAWVYDRAAVAAGEPWRLLTGHWVHTDPRHLAWNVGALVFLGWLFEARLGARLLPVLLIALATVDAWMWWALPSLSAHCGLSALLNALLAVGLWWSWRRDRSALGLAVGLGWLGKTLAEATTGTALFTNFD